MAIVSTSQPPAPERLYECLNCKGRNKLKNLLVERPSPIEDGLLEVVFICPDCGKETHSYWMSEKLRLARDVSNNTIRILSVRRTQKNLDMAINIKEKYKNLFDEEQVRIKGILEKEDGRAA